MDIFDKIRVFLFCFIILLLISTLTVVIVNMTISDDFCEKNGFDTYDKNRYCATDKTISDLKFSCDLTKSSCHWVYPKTTVRVGE